MREITFAGVNLKTFGAYVSGEGAWVKPAPVYDRYQVPGRNGDVLMFRNRWENVQITYRLGITGNFKENYQNLAAHLLSKIGYKELTDTAYPGLRRLAVVASGLTPELGFMSKAGQVEVTFDCQPQMFMNPVSAKYYPATDSSNGINIENPSKFPADFMLTFNVASGNSKVAGFSIAGSDISASHDGSGGSHAIKMSIDGVGREYYIDYDTGEMVDQYGIDASNKFTITTYGLATTLNFFKVPGNGILQIMPNQSLGADYSYVNWVQGTLRPWTI